VKLKEHTEARVRQIVDAYLDNKAQAEQTTLPLDVPDLAVAGDGSIFAPPGQRGGVFCCCRIVMCSRTVTVQCLH